MKHETLTHKFARVLLVAMLVLASCTKELVKDNTRQPTAGTNHCSGSEWADNSSLAVLPIPVVAFFVPHADLPEIKADNYLRQCGDPTKLVNREVEVHKGACIPAGLTRIVTLGIWQWCPAHVDWKADVKD